MNTFYEHHHDSIRFAYRCFDCILLNGLIQAARARREILQQVPATVPRQPAGAVRHRHAVTTGLSDFP